ncbi:Uncharacterized protein Fot_13276 [Forsythia ovata]|uniref:Uncharacterized protein n=1 Tax=Forsythia ovata TaxID=205694 RepID=A0ABD1W556_9LAMI
MMRSSFNKDTPHIDTSLGEFVVSEGDADMKSRLFRASWTRSLNSSSDLRLKSERSDILLLSSLNEINYFGTFFFDFSGSMASSFRAFADSDSCGTASIEASGC